MSVPSLSLHAPKLTRYAVELRTGKGGAIRVQCVASGNRELFRNLRQLYPKAAIHILASCVEEALP